MTEENKFKCIDTISLYDDGIGYCKLYDASHANESEEQRIWTVSTISSLAYGNDEASNPERLYQKLKDLRHESLFEFIRIGTDRYTTIGYSYRGINPCPYTPQFTKEHKSNIACFRIKVPIFVARQFMRHRAFSYLEMSRRYTKDSKQSFQFWYPKDYPHDREAQDNSYMIAYKHAIHDGYHTQVASRFLPQTTYTEFYVMGEVEGLKNFFALRLSPHAQEEIRAVALAMYQLIQKHQPDLWKKFQGEDDMPGGYR